VKRNVKTILRSHVKQSASHRILANAMRITQHTVRNAVSDRFPRPPEIRRLVDERIAIVHLVKVDRDVSSAWFVTRWFDVADRAERRQVGNVLRDVGPILTTIARYLHETVIRSYPDQSLR